MSLDLIITAENGRSTVYTKAQLLRDARALARQYCVKVPKSKLVAAHIAVGPNTIQLVVHMRSPDGWGENISEAI